MDFLVRYWSETETQIVTRYLGSKFLDMPKHVKFCVKVMDMLEKNSLDTQLFFSLSMDGPNINKSLWEKVGQIVSLRFSGLLLLVMCY